MDRVTVDREDQAILDRRSFIKGLAAVTASVTALNSMPVATQEPKRPPKQPPENPADQFLSELRKEQEWPKELEFAPTITAFLQELGKLGKQRGFHFSPEEAKIAIEKTFAQTIQTETKLERLFSPRPLDAELEDVELGMTLRAAPLQLMRGVVLGSPSDGCCWTTYKYATKSCS